MRLSRPPAFYSVMSPLWPRTKPNTLDPMKQSTAPSPLVKLALVGIAGIAFFYVSEGVGQVSKLIRNLPVEGTAFSQGPTAASAPMVAPDIASIHPLLVESSRKVTSSPTEGEGPQAQPVEQVTGMVSMDKLFERVEPIVAAPKQGGTVNLNMKMDALVFDFKHLLPYVQLQATSKDGAIINGHFYSVGEKIQSAAFVREATDLPEYPTFESMTSESVVLGDPKNPKSTITVRLSR